MKLADLGSSCWRDEQFSPAIGTQEYRAPEVILDWGYDTSADVWSAACLAYELATGSTSSLLSQSLSLSLRLCPRTPG